ncbi:mitochondrial inner membrane protein OXA1 isoform X1 [Abrus precatorius]|uniref:Mitochondrial inner membrane protein OXA1 isoform X1 n=1 Tax=Abrus precatorius TaxID=3816 RepID=A0A8B8KRT5_ABRPR|nr:mitochondrial inner membrane protein OXA1 isoform X1 [Abrus precatorius]
MAYRRCLLIRGNLVDRRCYPSFSYVLHSDEGKREHPDEKPSSAGITNFAQIRSFGSSLNGSMGFFAPSQDRFLSPCTGYNFCRYMSTVNQGSDKIDIMTDVADVLTDTTMETVASQAPVVDEVALAAADSFLPVKALQYVIDAVHSYTGLNWWAAIVITTLLIRSATFPLLINQLKATSKLTLMRPRLEEIKQEMEGKTMDPIAVAEGQKKMKKLFKEYGVSPFTPMKGLFIQGPVFISFFLAVTNMAEKVPSFKHGGASWFTDLTTPDALYIFPVLAALSFLITVECNMQEGMEGNPAAGTMKNISRGLAVLTVPFTMGFPKAIFCYWVTSNLFSLVYGLGKALDIFHLQYYFVFTNFHCFSMLKVPGVKKTLGVPEITAAAPSTSPPQSPFSIFPALKQATSVKNGPSKIPEEPSRHSDKKISSSSVISQRLRSLEKQVKGRKKNKKGGKFTDS